MRSSVQRSRDKPPEGKLLAQPSTWRDSDDATIPSLSTQLSANTHFSDYQACGQTSESAVIQPYVSADSQWFYFDSLHPVKAATDEFELVTVKKMQLHVELVLVHFAIQNQLIHRWAFESEVSTPVFAVMPGVGKR